MSWILEKDWLVFAKSIQSQSFGTLWLIDIKTCLKAEKISKKKKIYRQVSFIILRKISGYKVQKILFNPMKWDLRK